MLVILLMAPLIGLFVFRPMYKAARSPPPKMQFRLADMIVLFVQLQLVLVALLSLVPIDKRDTENMVALSIFVAFVWLLVGLAWFSGVFMLSRAGVTHAGRRTVFLGFLVPLGYLATLPIIASPVLALVVFTVLMSPQTNGAEAFVLLIVALDIIAVFGCRGACREIVQEERDKDGLWIMVRKD